MTSTAAIPKSPHNPSLSASAKASRTLITCMGLLGLLSGSLRASPCSWGEFFTFVKTGSGGSATFALTGTDIDRTAVNATLTSDVNTANVNVVPITYNDPISFQPWKRDAALPSLQVLHNTGDPVAQTFTLNFGKPMRNLLVYFPRAYSDRYATFTFTDSGGAAVPVGLHSYKDLVTPLNPGGAENGTFYQPSSNSVRAEGGIGTVAIGQTLQVLKITVTFQVPVIAQYIELGFGQFCDSPGLTDPCFNPRFAEWDGAATPTASVRTGNIVTAQGKMIGLTATPTSPVTLGTGGLSTNNTEGGGFIMPPAFRASTGLAAFSNRTSGADLVYTTYAFGEVVSTPGFCLYNANPGKYTFTTSGGAPLPFVVRDHGVPSATGGIIYGRQTEANVWTVGTTLTHAILQFTVNTQSIVMKWQPTTFASNPITSVFLNCGGVSAAAGTGAGTDTDGDGVPDIVDKCPDTPAGAVVGSDGCPLPTDLSIVKTASVTRITPGVPFTYTITVTNTGAEANNVKASDIVPAGLTINSISASDGVTPTQAGQTVQAVWPIVPNGGVRTLAINVTKP